MSPWQWSGLDFSCPREKPVATRDYWALEIWLVWTEMYHKGKIQAYHKYKIHTRCWRPSLFFLMWDIYNSFLYWSQVGSAYSDLKQSLDSQPAIEVGSWQRESWIPAPKSVVSDKAPGPSVLQKIIPIKIESSEKSKVFIRKKKYSTCRQTQNHFNGAFPPGFLWPIILLCLVLSLYLVYFRILPSRRVPLSAKMDSREEAYG